MTNLCTPTSCIADTGCSKHFFQDNDDVPSEPAKEKTFARLPNNQRMVSTKETHLNVDLNAEATKTSLLPTINHNLLSVGQLCNNGCKATFTKQKVIITKNNKIILEGTRDHTTKMWHMNVQFKRKQETINNVYQLTTKAAQLQYLHACAGYPVPSTWIKAIKKGFYLTWPGLTAKAVVKNLPKSIVTAQGHQTLTRQNIRSTKKEHKVYAITFDTHHQLAMDLTGRFPVQSSKGHRYILILWDGDSNAILAEPMRNRSDAEYIRAYQALVKYLKERGTKPELQRLDNEASKALKAEIKEEDMLYQLAPPHNHRTNPAEKALQTFKNHFVAILAGTDPDFPLHLWCRLVKPAQATLNMLRASNTNPNISAYMQLEGNFDFNATPLAPLGTKALIHERPKQRGTWATHGVLGWYIGPEMEHYRCHNIYVPKTRAERASDTVEFFPTHVHIPQTKTADEAIEAAKHLTKAIQNAAKTPTTLTQTQTSAIQQLADIFQKQTAPPEIDVAPITEADTMEQVPLPTAEQLQQIARAILQQIQKQSSDKHAKEPRVGKPNKTQPRPQPRVDKPKRTQTMAPTSHKFIGRQSLRPRDGGRTHIICAVFDEESGKMLEYRQLVKHPKYAKIWSKSFANELGRLAQGIRDIKGTNTIVFIPKDKVPQGRTVTYGRIVCELRPMKKEVERTRLTVGGDLINYPFKLRTETADLMTVKLLINSTISTPGARFLCLDVKNFYLNTPMPRYEYMRLPIALIPQEIIDHYKLTEIAVDGYVYCEIQKGMYGLPQAGIIANDLLRERLEKHGYYPSKVTPGLWHHITRPTKFTLIVDDFGCKVEGNHGNHLIDTLRQYYEVSVDESGSLYTGMTLDWDYPNKRVETSMPKYLPDLLQKINHPTPKRPVDNPSRYTPPIYGKSAQELQHKKPPPPATKEDIKKIMMAVGSLLYYGRASDPTLLHGLNDIASEQSAATTDTNKALIHLLDYCSTHPDAKVRFMASDMILHIHSDASYLTASNA